MPYRDFWDHKPPGITLFHSIPIRLFGHSLLAVRVHEVFWLAISATIFLYLCRGYLSPGIAVLSLAFYCLLVSSKLLMRSGGLTEESALTLYALAYVFALRRRGSVRLNIFLAGLFLGLAAQFRQPFGLSVIFIALCLLWRPEESEVAFGRRVRLLPILAAGAVLPEVICSGYFLLKGIWGQYFEASYLFSFVYLHGALDPDVVGLEAGFQKHWEIIKGTGPYLVSPLFAAPLLLWLPRQVRRIGALLIVAFLCDFAAISLGGRYYEHYYLQAAISSCFLLGIAFQAVYGRLGSIAVAKKRRSAEEKVTAQLDGQSRPVEERGPQLRRRLLSLPLYWYAGAMVGACVLLSGSGLRKYVKSYRQGLEEKAQPRGERARHERIGKAIRTVTKPQERVLLLGARPTSVYFLGQRLAGSRYYHLSPFFRKAFAQSVRERHRERFVADLKSRKPVLIIMAREERQMYFDWMEMIENSAAKFLVSYSEEDGERKVHIAGMEYVPLEKFFRRPWSKEGWSWYRRECSFLIRKDKVEEVRERLEQEEAGGP